MKFKLFFDNNSAALVIAREPRASIATCTDSKNLVKGLTTPLMDKDYVDSDPSVAQPSMVEHHLWLITVGKMKIEGSVSSFKGCIHLIQVTFQPSSFLAHSPMLGSSNLNMNREPKVIEKPKWSLEGNVDSEFCAKGY
ncbi:hypothetical protein V6N13_030014 [Hibiscus sabdariffa]|uniref:Uncharacterized protein n=2 Tax=Hibiscus sabdariffa TaxID=183260 RepID=A0ABR2T883_9ROSI